MCVILCHTSDSMSYAMGFLSSSNELEISPQCVADIDECKLKKHKCKEVCVNTQGSFRCGCKTGVLRVDGVSCGPSGKH